MSSFDQFSSTNLGLSYVAPAQAQKHVTVNESFRLLDAVVQLSVINKDLTAPPTTPNEGDRYIVATGANGDWIDQDNNLAAYQDGGWAYYTPLAGWITYVQDESVNYQFGGTVWVEISTGSVNNGDDVAFAQLGIGGATADATNILSLNGAAALFNNAGNGVQIKLNKNAVADTASFLFQTGFSGRAEMGLTGDDDFHFKVSPNGSDWYEAMSVNKATGDVSLKSESQTTLFIEGNGTGYHNGAIVFKAQGDAGRGLGVFLFHAANDIEWFAGNPYNDGDSFAITRQLTSVHNASTSNYLNALFKITNTGDVKIGTGQPTAKLDVDGAVKCKSYTVATLPSASGNGAGAMIYVSDETGGGVMAFSDSTDWRRVTDRAVVS